MKRLALVIALMALATAAFAADLTGKWTATMPGMDGGEMTLTYNFKQDGAKLTGSIEGPGGEPMQIADGKVEGNKFSFTISLPFGEGMKMKNEGTFEGDTAKLTSKMEGGDFPGGGPGGERPPTTLKRVK